MRTSLMLAVIAVAMWHTRAMSEDVIYDPFGESRNLQSADSAPTPMAEVNRVIGLLPEPKIAFADIGCGDGRVLIAAAEQWPGVPIIGIEIDPARADAARERVKAAGLERQITVVTGDAVKTGFSADVVFMYLYDDVIQKLLHRLKGCSAVASYMHEPKGLGAVRSGNSWIYTKPVQAAVQQQPYAVWKGQIYYGPNPGCNCEMCRSIVSQIASFPVVPAVVASPTKPAMQSPPKPKGKLVTFTVCEFDRKGRRIGCHDETRWVPDPQ